MEGIHEPNITTNAEIRETDKKKMWWRSIRKEWIDRRKERKRDR